MEELIGGLIVLVVVIVIAYYVIVYLLFPLAVILGTTGAIWGAAHSLRNYGAALYAHVRPERPGASTGTYPALRHYWFGKAYRDMWAAMQDSHARNMASASAYWQAVARGNWFAKLFCAAAAIAVVIAGTATWLMLVPLHTGIVGAVALAIASGFAAMYVAESCFLWYKGWSTVCRHCGESVSLPEFQCPHCRTWHPRLCPSSFGILSHRCRCGEKLPSTFVGKRYKLAARCPFCRKPLNAELETRSTTTVIPFIGSPSSGKTALMVAAMETLFHDLGPAYGLDGSFTDAKVEAFFDDEKRHIEASGMTRKTADRQPPAFDAVFESADGKRRHQVLLFDAAGEIYLESDRLHGHYQFKNVTGGVFVVDPFGLPALRAKYGDVLRKAGLDSSVAQDEAIDIVDRFLIGMQRHFGLSPDRLVTRPYAVVVTKADLCQLRKQLAPPIAAGLDDAQKRDLLSDHIRSKLQEWGAGGLVNQLEGRFAKVMYFAAAPITLHKNGAGVSAKLTCWNVDSALEWILETVADPLAKGAYSA